MKKLNLLLSTCVACSFIVTPAQAKNLCKIAKSGDYEEGFYLPTYKSGKLSLQQLMTDQSTINKKKQKIVYISDRGKERNGLIIFQVLHKEVKNKPKKLKPGKHINITRDKIDFLCSGEEDKSPLVSSKTNLIVSEKEYDRYHRFFYVNKKKVGEQLYQLFHINYLKNDKSCVRTDHVSRRFLFLLNNRMNNYGRLAGLFDRLPFKTSQAIAASENSELNQVIMKKYTRIKDQVGCAVLNLKPYGASVKIEATDIEDSFFKRVLLPDGNFHKVELKVN